MTFEEQVIEKLEVLDNKLDIIVEWKAGTQPVIDRHTEQINTLKLKMFGNGTRGIERRLDSVEEYTKTIKRIWMALLIAAALAAGSFAMQIFQAADNPAPSKSNPASVVSP